MGLFRVIIYGIMFSVYAGSLFYDAKYIPRVGYKYWAYKLVMLSMLNFVLQTVYSFICLLCSIFDWNEEVVHKKQIRNAHVPSYWRQTKLHRICDFLYYTAAFPIGIGTCLLFWGLYTYDPAWVMSDEIQKTVPNWMNHISHTAPLGFLLVDTLLTCHHAPTQRTGSNTIILFTLFYMIM